MPLVNSSSASASLTAINLFDRLINRILVLFTKFTYQYLTVILPNTLQLPQHDELHIIHILTQESVEC